MTVLLAAITAQSDIFLISRFIAIALIGFLILANTCFIFYRALFRSLKGLSVWFKKDTMKEEHLLLEIAHSYLRTGKKDKALKMYYQYLQKVPNDADICFRVAKLLSSDDPETAMLYLRRAALLGHKDAALQIKKSKRMQTSN